MPLPHPTAAAVGSSQPSFPPRHPRPSPPPPRVAIEPHWCAAGLSAEKHARLRLIADAAAPLRTVVELSVANKRQHYTAGQWVFVCVPALGALHWHPFTISSASGDARLSVHMLCGSHWTGRVRELAERSQSVRVRRAPPRVATCKRNCQALTRHVLAGH